MDLQNRRITRASFGNKENGLIGNQKAAVKANDAVVARRAFAENRNTREVDRIQPTIPKPVKELVHKQRPVTASPPKRPEVVGIDREYQTVAFMDDIYNYLLMKEKQHVVPEDGVNSQMIKPKMRSILVDWLVQVHSRFHLFAETLHLTVYLVDCCLAKMKVEKTELQLVGMACMLVACKFEEMYVPDIKDFEYIADNAFSKQQIMKMEIKVLGAADYILSRPHSMTFIRWIAKEAETAIRQQYLAKYFSEIALLEESVTNFLPSQIALLSLYLAYAISSKEFPTARLVKLINWTEDGLTAVVPTFVRAVLRMHCQDRLAAVRQKYSGSKFHAVANIPVDELEIIKRL